MEDKKMVNSFNKEWFDYIRHQIAKEEQSTINTAGAYTNKVVKFIGDRLKFID